MRSFPVAPNSFPGGQFPGSQPVNNSFPGNPYSGNPYSGNFYDSGFSAGGMMPGDWQQLQGQYPNGQYPHGMVSPEMYQHALAMGNVHPAMNSQSTMPALNMQYPLGQVNPMEFGVMMPGNQMMMPMMPMMPMGPMAGTQDGQMMMPMVQPMLFPTGGQPHYPEVPDYHFYQTMLLHAAARQQAESLNRANREAANAEAQKQANENWTLNNLVPVKMSSPLFETLLVCAKTMSPYNVPTGPDKGVGKPLVGKSWLDHPYYFGGFVGTMYGAELVSRMIDQKNGGTGGLYLGYNLNDYWGLEGRLHFTSLEIRDTAYARNMFINFWEQTNPDMPVPAFTSRTNELTVFDLSVHYYPLGNAKWRPYFKYGLGVGNQDFVNTFGYPQSSTIVTMPLGFGLKYWWNERLALQSTFFNNIIFASGSAKTQHNFTFSAGISYAFGSGKRLHPTHYWPATPSMSSRLFR